MGRDDHQQMTEFEWMRARVGLPDPGTSPTGESDEAARLRRQVEELRSENRSLRASAEGADRSPVETSRGRRGGARTPTLAEVERDHILKVLLDCHWRVKGPDAAAELLGLNPGTLYSRMKKLGIQRDDNR